MLNDRHWSSLITWAKNQGWHGTPTKWSERDTIAEEIIEYVDVKEKRGLGNYSSAIEEIRSWITIDKAEDERRELERRISYSYDGNTTSYSSMRYCNNYQQYNPYEYHNGYRVA